MATIVDVARKAGVSVSTVSYALSGTRPIREETRQRVLQAVEALDYHPNLLARGLVSKRTKIIALLYPTDSSDYLDDVQLDFIASVANMATYYRYGLLLFTSLSGERDIQRFIKEKLVDGLVLMEVQVHDPRVALMQELGYPFSLIGHCEVNEGISFVDLDFYTALRLCVNHLAGLKHREIAFIPRFEDFANSQHNYIIQSVRGFNTTVAELGIKGTILGSKPSAQCGYETMIRLLEEQPGLSAVIAGNDPIYGGVIQALREKGLEVPRDFSTIGMLSQRLAERYDPQVTTLTIPSNQMGRLGTEFLIRKLEGQEREPQQVMLAPELTIRQSTARYRKRM
jgi:DNA-binding LacI/PurR family transcriptional regulator